MNKKLVKEFLIITFVIMLIFWGGCALISQIFNLTINTYIFALMLAFPAESVVASAPPVIQEESKLFLPFF